ARRRRAHRGTAARLRGARDAGPPPRRAQRRPRRPPDRDARGTGRPGLAGGGRPPGRRERGYKLPRFLRASRPTRAAMIVAIDGPAGAGKSTVARRLAERLGFGYLDTGAMYRALTWLALQEGLPPGDAQPILPLGDAGPIGELARLSPVTFDEEGRVFIAGVDVTAAIRQSRIDRMVPVVARHQPVREVMRERQRELAGRGNIVIEGRDIGTIV